MFFHGYIALVGLDLLTVEVLESHSDTAHSVRLLQVSDWLDADTLPDNTQHSQATGIHSLMGFEPTILPASEQPQTHALDRTVTGTSKLCVSVCEMNYLNSPEN
jgi:hypothetical protein